jgi:hypothetical protein
VFKNVDPSDVSVKQFVTNKRFTVSDIDSGSGVFGLTGTSSSMYAFAVDTADATTFTNTTAPCSHSFFHIPVYRQINHLYYRDFPKPYNSYCFASESIRKLHSSLTAITVPREFYGEKINPGSIELTDDSADSTFTIVDDRKGNLYDNNFSSSFAQRSASANGSGSQVGNVFYEHGILVFTDTGSYSNVGTGKGGNGFQLQFEATQTHYEYEIGVTANEGEFNSTNNISISQNRSGSIRVLSGTTNIKSVFAPGDNPSNGTGSLAATYTPTEEVEGFATHSEFRPYVTTVGLYNDQNDLLVIGKLGRPIKNDDDLSLKFIVRFDV